MGGKGEGTGNGVPPCPPPQITGRNNESHICRHTVRTSTILSSLWIFVSLKSTEFGHHNRSYIENTSLTLQEIRSIHDSMNIPKIEFIFQCGCRAVVRFFLSFPRAGMGV